MFATCRKNANNSVIHINQPGNSTIAWEREQDPQSRLMQNINAILGFQRDKTSHYSIYLCGLTSYYHHQNRENLLIVCVGSYVAKPDTSQAGYCKIQSSYIAGPNLRPTARQGMIDRLINCVPKELNPSMRNLDLFLTNHIPDAS